MAEGPRRSLLGSSAVVAAGTALSRITGLGRVVALAYALGTTVLADAYNLANTTPNIVYDLVLGGILAATLVPVVVERFDHDDRAGVDALATTITLVLVATTLVALALAPLFVRLYTIDLDASEAREQTSLALPLLLLFLPQVLFYGLSALWTALLNARRSFAAPAFAPVLNNLVVICLFLALPHLADEELTLSTVRDDLGLLLLVGVGTTAGIVAMTLVLWPVMRREGIRLHWNPDWRNPAVTTVARLSGWTLGYVAVSQVSLFVVLALLNGTGEGAVSAYSYAWLFFQVPHGLIAVSIMTTFTPELAKRASRGEEREFGHSFTIGLRLVLLVVLPTAVALVTLAEPLLGLLLRRGAFGDASVETTTTALVWLAAGLPAFSVFLYTMRGFYAWKDTRTPFFLNAVENAATVLLALLLVEAFGLSGVLGAWGVSYLALALVALVVLAQRFPALEARSLVLPSLRQLAAASAMAIVIVVTNQLVSWGSAPADELLHLLLGGVAGFAVYLGTLWILRSDDLQVVREAWSGGTGAPEAPVLP